MTQTEVQNEIKRVSGGVHGTSPETQWPPIQAGTVLHGRYAAVSPIFERPEASVWNATDEHLDSRRSILVAVPNANVDDCIAVWSELDGPETATLIDAIEIIGGTVGVFSLPDDARLASKMGGLSRSQAAALLLTAVDVFERARELPTPPIILHPELLFVRGRPRQVALHALVIPTFERDEEAVCKGLNAELDHLLHLFGGWLLGFADRESLEASLPSLPDDVASWLQKIVERDEDDVLDLDLDVSALEAALGVDREFGTRVPVPVGPVDGATSSAAGSYQSRQRRAVGKGRRELIAAGALIGTLLLALSSLLTTQARPGGFSSTVEESVAAEAFAESSVPPESEAPESAGASSSIPAVLPEVRTPAAETIRLSTTDAVAYRATTHSIVPAGVVEIADGQIPMTADFYRIRQDSQGRVERIDDYLAPEIFAGYATYTYDDDDRVSRVQRYSSTGSLESTVNVLWDDEPVIELDEIVATGLLRGREPSGRPTPALCDTVEFGVDESGFIRLQRCVDQNRRPAVYEGGYHAIRYTPTANNLIGTISFLDRSGEPIAGADGHAGVVIEYTGGAETRRRFVDEEGAPTLSLAWGAAIVETLYQRSATVETRLYDAEGERVIGAEGWYRETRVLLIDEPSPDSGVRTIRVRYDDDRLARVARRSDGVMSEVHTLDGNSRIRQTEFFDENLAPATDRYGTHRIEYVRDTHGNVLRQCEFGIGGTSEPILSRRLDNAHCVVYGQDPDGYVTSRRYFGLGGEPVLVSIDGLFTAHAIHYSRGPGGIVRAVAYADTDGEGGVGPEGVSTVRYRHDQFGNEVGYEYFGEFSRAMTTPGGIAGGVQDYDEERRWIRHCFVNLEGERTLRPRGGFACTEREFEDHLLARIRYTDASGEPVNALLLDDPRIEASSIDLFYDEFGRLSSQTLYDVDGGIVPPERRDCSIPHTCVGPSGLTWF